MTATGVDGPRVHVKRAPSAPKRIASVQRAVLHTLSRAAPFVRGDVTVVLTGDAAIRALNRRYRGRDSATDVLSFELGDGLTPGEPFGDIVVSAQTARRQARDYGAPLQDEIVRLVIHGTLHLCGFDHGERRAAARMHGLARRLFKELHAGA